MPFNKELNKDFFVKEDCIQLSNDYLKSNSFRFKKITGTRLASVLGLSKFNSPFKQWCFMVNIYEEKMDPVMSKIGWTVEPKVRDLVCQQLGGKYKDYVPKDVKYDVFKDIDEVFGGIPDGEPMNDKGEVDYSTGLPMLEVKTASIDSFKYKKVKGCFEFQKDANGTPIVKETGTKKLSWFNNDGEIQISTEYQYQLGLYLYLRQAKKGVFAVCFLPTEAYADPEAYQLDMNQVYLIDYVLDNPESMKKNLEIARKWYAKYIKSGISPKMTEEDKIWLKEVELIK